MGPVTDAEDDLGGMPTNPAAAPIIPVAVGILPGRVLAGRYEILAKLGHGGMGAVFRAHDRELGEDVALKVILPERIRDAGVLDRFRREVKLARKIAHPNVCRVFDVGEEGTTRFLTMEFIEGKSLRELIAKGPLDPARALSILQQIIQGMVAVHAQGIVHRDLKPDNVMVREGGQAVVADFGLARTPTGDVAESNFVGTPAYMSPEQLRGEALDGRSDIFALGIVAYELMTGRLPFTGESIAAIATATLRDSPASFEVPGLAESAQRGIKAAIFRALEKRPADRFASMAEFGDALSSAGVEHSISTLTGPVLPPDERPRKRLPWSAIAGLAATVVLLVVIIKLWQFPTNVAVQVQAPVSSALPSTHVVAHDAQAERLYQQAMQAMHDGDESRAMAEMERVVAIDHDFGAAELRLAIWWLLVEPVKARSHQIAANRLRKTLDQHDADLLHAMNAWLEQPPDIQGWGMKLEALAERYPQDVEALLLVAGVRIYQMRFDGAIQATTRALEIDPTNVVAWTMKADALALLGDTKGQLEAYSACLSVAPTATKCLVERIRLRGHMRECQLMKEDAKALLMLEPNSAATHELLATALESTSERRESVINALEKSFSLQSGSERTHAEAKARAALAIRDGDFESAVRWLEQRRARNATDIHQDSHALPAIQLALVSLEMGLPKQADEIVSDFLRQKEAWLEDLDNDWAMLFSCIDLHAGGMSSATFVEQRQRWIERIRKKWENAGRKDNEELEWLIWSLGYGCPAETRTEALEALKKMPHAKSPLVALGRLGTDFFEGKIHILTGEYERAIPLLRRAANTCNVFDEPLMPMRATYYLGLALQGKGDETGARSAFQQIVDRWGKAKPRSVTAEKAKKALEKLGGDDKPVAKPSNPFGSAIDTRR